MGVEYYDEDGNALDDNEAQSGWIDDSEVDPSQFDFQDPYSGAVSSYDEDVHGTSQYQGNREIAGVYPGGQQQEIAGVMPSFQRETIQEEAPQEEVEYYNATTGEIIKDYDPAKYEIVPEVSPWEKMIDSFKSRGERFKQSYYGYKELLGYDPEESALHGKQAGERSAELAKSTTGGYYTDLIAGAAPAITEAGVGIGLTAALGPVGLAASMGEAGLETFGSEYSQTKDVSASTTRAGVDALIDGVTNKVPLLNQFKGYTKAVGASVGTGVGTSYLSSLTREVTQQADVEEKGLYDTDYGKAFTRTNKQFNDGLGQTILVSGLAGAGGQAILRRQQNKAAEVDAGFDPSKMKEPGLLALEQLPGEGDVPLAPPRPDIEVEPLRRIEGPKEFTDIEVEPQRRIGYDPREVIEAGYVIEMGMNDSAIPKAKPAPIIKTTDTKPPVIDDAFFQAKKALQNEYEQLANDPNPTRESLQREVQLAETLQQLEKITPKQKFDNAPLVDEVSEPVIPGPEKQPLPRYEFGEGAPITTAIEQLGGIRGRSKLSGGEYDSAPTISEIGGMARKIYRKDGDVADGMHRQLVEKGLLSPDSTIDEMWSAIRRERAAATKQKAEIAQMRYQIKNPVIAESFVLAKENFQETRPNVGEGRMIDIEANAADLVRNNEMSSIDAIATADKANQYRQILERKAAQLSNEEADVLSRSAQSEELEAIQRHIDNLDYLQLDLDLLGRLSETDKPNLNIYNARRILEKEGALKDLASDPELRAGLDAERYPSINEDERGSINLAPVGMLADAINESFIRPKNFQRDKYAQEYMNGKIGGYDVPGLSDALKVYRTQVKRMTDLSRKIPEAREAFLVQEGEDHRMHELGMKHAEVIKPALQVLDRSKMQKMLKYIFEETENARAQGKRFVVTDEGLRATGATETDIAGVKAVLKTNEVIFDDWRESFKTNVKDHTRILLKQKVRDIHKDKNLSDADKSTRIEKVNDEMGKLSLKKQEIINQVFDEMKRENYIPAMRDANANFYVNYTHPTDPRLSHYAMVKTNREMRKVIKNLEARGIPAEKIDSGTIKKSELDSEKGLDYATVATFKGLKKFLEIDGMDGQMEMDFVNPKIQNADDLPKYNGFKGHMMPRKGIGGYREDFMSGQLDYMQSAAASIARNEFHGKKVEQLEKVSNRGIDAVKKEIKDYFLYNQSPETARTTRLLMKLAAHDTLGVLNPSSALIDYTGIPLVTAPELLKYNPNPLALVPVMKRASDWLRTSKREAFVKANPELANALDQATRAGVLGSNQVAGLTTESGISRKDLNQARDKTKIERIEDLSMMLKSAADSQGRVIAFIAGWENAPKGVSKQRFAYDFVDRTQGLYGPRNRPKMARSQLGRVFYQMKEFTHNYYANQAQNLGDLFGDIIDRIKLEKKGSNVTPEQRKELNKAILGDIRRVAAYPGALLLLGGIRALPGVQIVSKAVGLINDVKDDDLDDPMDWIRRKKPDGIMGDMLMGGMLGQIPRLWGAPGFSIAGQINPGSMAPDLDRNPVAELGKIAGGVVGNMIAGKADTFNQVMRNTGDLGYAATEVAPKGIRSPKKALEALSSGEWLNRKKQPMIYEGSPEGKYTGSEAFFQALGFPSSRLVDIQEISSRLYKAGIKDKEAVAGMANRIVSMRNEGRYEEADALEQQLVDDGRSTAAIRRLENESPDPIERAIAGLRKKDEKGQAIADLYTRGYFKD